MIEFDQRSFRLEEEKVAFFERKLLLICSSNESEENTNTREKDEGQKIIPDQYKRTNMLCQQLTKINASSKLSARMFG